MNRGTKRCLGAVEKRTLVSSGTIDKEGRFEPVPRPSLRNGTRTKGTDRGASGPEERWGEVMQQGRVPHGPPVDPPAAGARPARACGPGGHRSGDGVEAGAVGAFRVPEDRSAARGGARGEPREPRARGPPRVARDKRKEGLAGFHLARVVRQAPDPPTASAPTYR